MDVSDEMLVRARQKAAAAGLAAEFRAADAEQLPLPDASFDLVIERHAIWTLPNPSGALLEWARVLRPAGRLVLVEGDWQSSGHHDYAPIRDALPLYGGRPASHLEALVRAHAFGQAVIEPLIEAALWVEPPERDRYALHAWRDGTSS